MESSPNYLNPRTLASLQGLDLQARLVMEGYVAGMHKSPYHGFSVEFAEHREYSPGDDIRHVDWKVWSRTDKYYLKQYEEETNLRCLIALDISPSMFYPEQTKGKVRFSIKAAAALSYLLHRQRDAVGLCLFDDKIQNITPVKSTPTHLDKIFTVLNSIDSMKPAQRNTSVAGVLHEVAEKIHGGEPRGNR